MDLKSKLKSDDDSNLYVAKKTSSHDGSEITVKQFLEFLKTAYQVTDSVEGVLLAEGMTQAVDWIKLKESELVKPREASCQTTETREFKKKSDSSISTAASADTVKHKLSEILSEGLFDSVLNHMIPSNPPSVTNFRRSSTQKLEKSSNASIANNERCVARRKSSDAASSSKSQVFKTTSEVIIHVCDEVKNIKKDFVCNQSLLVEKMAYFAEVTAGQRLEDMDISVHCDVGIFEWLMLWVKKDQADLEAPELDPQCVTPVLVSAAFLQMEPLLQECLLFCHRHMNDILRTSTNLSCLNDAVMTRLAAMYTNTEVEAIRDRKDKIQSRLYCKLIQSLCEPETESMRGHWNSLARVYRCGRCQLLVSPSTSEEIPCVSACMQIMCDGTVVYKHEMDPSWNINEHIEQLYRTLKTWRKIYWRLWGEAHFLYCSACKRYFQCHQMGWCRFHPDPPQFFTVDAQRAPLPVGRFPCCGERAYRFEIIERESGCQFREHTPATDSVRDNAVLSLLENFRSLIEEEPAKLIFPERLTRLVGKDNANGDAETSEGTSENEHFWWDGLVLIPPRPKLGLLGYLDDARKFVSCEEQDALSTPESGDDLSDSSESSSSNSVSSSATGSSQPKSEESSPSTETKEKESPHTRRAIKKRAKQLWQCNLSARSNQDLQRAYEESALKQIQTMLTRRTLMSVEAMPKSVNKVWPRHITPPGALDFLKSIGGTWVRLESEWKDRTAVLQQQHKLRNIFNGKFKIKTRYN